MTELAVRNSRPEAELDLADGEELLDRPSSGEELDDLGCRHVDWSADWRGRHPLGAIVAKLVP